MRNEWIVDLLAVLIALVWVASVVASYFDRDWRPPPTIHLVMMALVGAVFGAKIFRKIERGGGKDDRG